MFQLRLAQLGETLEVEISEVAVKKEVSEPLDIDVDNDENENIEESIINTIVNKVVKESGKTVKREGTKASTSSKSTGSRAPQKCNVCKTVLSSRGALTKHMITHQEKKPFKCDDCSQSFNQARDLKTHTMQKHSGQRPHVCGICGKGFVHKFYLMEHMTYHTGERKFQCFHCGKRFQAQNALTKHMKRHTTAKDFACEICAKTFAVRTDLKSHVKLVHEKPACSKGIPIEPIKSLSYDLNFQPPGKESENVAKSKGSREEDWLPGDKSEEWRKVGGEDRGKEREGWGDEEDRTRKEEDGWTGGEERSRTLESSHLEEWMLEQTGAILKLKGKEGSLPLPPAAQQVELKSCSLLL